MNILTYVRLIGFTAGTLLMLFWMVVILGYRRQRNFERVLFFLCLALFLFYAGSLLSLNSQIYYSSQPPSLQLFSTALIAAGLTFLPPLIFHLHAEYAETRGHLGWGAAKRVILLAAYAPVAYFALRVYAMLATAQQFNVPVPGSSLGRAYGIWLILALVCGAGWQRNFAKYSPRKLEARFHWFVFVVLCAAGALVYEVHFHFGHTSSRGPLVAETALALTSILPLAILIYLVQRHDFLQFGRQKNLVYAVTVTFLALLYLSLVRRVSVWLEPFLPPEASGAILLFVLVIFFEPLQRVLSQRLQTTAKLEMDRTQKVLLSFQAVARKGNPEGLKQFAERELAEEYSLQRVSLVLFSDSPATLVTSDSGMRFPIQGAERPLGELIVVPHGGMVSGETQAAMEFLCEQLPSAIDLCRAVEEKTQLERELAERERLALVGQTAASISHNLKNPLGSIKTILQVQLENPELPESMRGETKMVLDEISRLSAKLNQLLQFSRPAVRGNQALSSCDADAAVREVIAVLKPEADRRGVSLQFQRPSSSIFVAIPAEALNDILSNLIVNALEAAPSGGKVIASLHLLDLRCEIAIEDDGPGIPIAAQEKVLQPFFTTKSQGTGLGLAIVARRVSESSGKLEFQSPIAGGKGTRFRVSLPLAARSSLNA